MSSRININHIWERNRRKRAKCFPFRQPYLQISACRGSTLSCIAPQLSQHPFYFLFPLRTSSLVNVTHPERTRVMRQIAMCRLRKRSISSLDEMYPGPNYTSRWASVRASCPLKENRQAHFRRHAPPSAASNGVLVVSVGWACNLFCPMRLKRLGNRPWPFYYRPVTGSMLNVKLGSMFLGKTTGNKQRNVRIL